MAYNFTLLDPKYYSDLHDFYQKVATADQQQLVLTRATGRQRKLMRHTRLSSRHLFSAHLCGRPCLCLPARRVSQAGFQKASRCRSGAWTQPKRTTPDYAKDASAVILYDEYVETIDAQGRAVEREREAIRILEPQGRGNTCAVGYDVDEKINYFRVWTIAADEKQYQAQDTDFTEAGDTDVPIMLSTRKTRIAHPPAVDVGAVEICESEELMEPYMQEKVWDIQNGIPVVFQALEIDLPAGRAHTQSWHNYAPVAPVEVAPNHWRWEVKDMHALILRDIPSHPDWAALAARMSVQWGDAAVAGRG